jgi:hypothetical protein
MHLIELLQDFLSILKIFYGNMYGRYVTEEEYHFEEKIRTNFCRFLVKKFKSEPGTIIPDRDPT